MMDIGDFDDEDEKNKYGWNKKNKQAKVNYGVWTAVKQW